MEIAGTGSLTITELYDGAGAIHAYLTNDSVVFPTASDGSVSDFSQGIGQFVVQDAAGDAIVDVVFELLSYDNALGSIDSVTGNYVVTALTADGGSLIFKATVNGTLFVTKILTLAKNRDGKPSITINLSNDSQTLPSDIDGLVSTYSGSGTSIEVLEGDDLLMFTTGVLAASQFKILSVTVDPVGAITPGSITGSGTNSAVVGNHSAMDLLATSCSIEFQVQVKRSTGETVTLVKRQSITKVSDGVDGIAGNFHSLVCSARAIGEPTANEYVPPSITFIGNMQVGDNLPTVYAGRFKIETTVDGVVFTTVYTSVSDESSKTFTVPPSIRGIRTTLYLAGGTTTYLDSEYIPVVSDGAEGRAAITSAFSNDNHTFPADVGGVVLSYARSGSTLQMFEGSIQLLYNDDVIGPGEFKITNVAVSPVLAIVPGTITGDDTYTATIAQHSLFDDSINTAVITYTVSVRRFNGETLTLYFDQTLSKSLGGTSGLDGESPTIKYIVPSTNIIVIDNAGTKFPDTVAFESRAITGADPEVSYPCRFKVQTTVDGTTFVTTYTSSVNETGIIYGVPSGIRGIKVSTYEPGGFITLIDSEYVGITADGEDGTSVSLLYLATTGSTFTFESPLTTTSISPVITLESRLTNLSGTVVWTAQAFSSTGTLLGTVSLGGAGNVRTLNSGQFTAPAGVSVKYVTITATLGAHSDTVTIHRLDKGSSALNMILSNSLHAVAATNAGTVSDWSTAFTMVSIFEGPLDVTNLWSITRSFVNASGPGVSGNGTYSVSVAINSLSADVGRAIITATRSGYATLTQDFTVVKQKAGVQGDTGATGPAGSSGSSGARGPGNFYSNLGALGTFPSMGGLTWNTESDNAVFSATGSTTKVIGDTVTLYATVSGLSRVNVGRWNGSMWLTHGVKIDGSLIVDGTLTAGTGAFSRVIIGASATAFLSNVFVPSNGEYLFTANLATPLTNPLLTWACTINTDVMFSLQWYDATSTTLYFKLNAWNKNTGAPWSGTVNNLNVWVY